MVVASVGESVILGRKLVALEKLGFLNQLKFSEECAKQTQNERYLTSIQMTAVVLVFNLPYMWLG